ncbi:MAG: hypothetical protein ACREB8_09460 [Pseudolabrys sp.]
MTATKYRSFRGRPRRRRLRRVLKNDAAMFFGGRLLNGCHGRIRAAKRGIVGIISFGEYQYRKKDDAPDIRGDLVAGIGLASRRHNRVFRNAFGFIGQIRA